MQECAKQTGSPTQKRRGTREQVGDSLWLAGWLAAARSALPVACEYLTYLLALFLSTHGGTETHVREHLCWPFVKMTGYGVAADATVYPSSHMDYECRVEPETKIEEKRGGDGITRVGCRLAAL